MGTVLISKQSKVYWRERVFRPVVDGKQLDNYCVRMSSGGLQRSLSLRTANREEAAQRARDWFVYLDTHGWAAFDAKYRKSASDTDSNTGTAILPTAGKTNVTVGNYLAAVHAESDLAHKTITDYAGCLRFILSEVLAIETGKRRRQKDR